MLGPEEQKIVNAGHRGMTFIWAGLASSGLIYMSIPFIAGGKFQGMAPAGEAVYKVRVALMVLSAIIVFSLGRVFKAIVRARTGAPQRGKAAMNPAAMALQAYMTASIAVLAMAEMIGVFGLTLYFLGDGIRVMAIFVAVSMGCMATYFPKRNVLADLAVALKRRTA